MSNWIWRTRQLLRGKSRNAEQTEELQAHLEMEVEAGLKMGLSPVEARRRARLRAGLVADGLESSRDELGFAWFDGAAADFRHAFRALTRSRGFAVVAVLVIAMSVAINTLIFCMFDGVVLKPLPYPSPERLVRLFDSLPNVPRFAMAIGRYLDYRANAKSLESIALYSGQDMELSGNEGKESRQLSGMAITQDYFAVLGKPVARGRAFADSDLLSKVRNVIISDRLWRDRFESDPNIVGKTIRLNREPWTIVGVSAAGLQHVGGDYRSTLQGETVDIWLPLALDMPELALRAFHYCNAVARIRAGVTEAQAKEDLTRMAGLYSQRYPDYGKWTVNVQSLLKEVEGRSEQVIWLLVGAGALVLLVACANIAGLAVARAVARRKELTLRHALGASRWQLLRVGLAENLLAGIAGAAAGLALAWAGMPLLRQLLPADFPRAHEIQLTATAALFAAAVAVLTGVIAGLLPSTGTLILESQRTTSGRDSRRLRTALVAGEVALAGLLCAGSLFLLRSYQQVTARDHGFNPSGALTFHTTLQLGEGAKSEAFAHAFDQICSRIRGVPGVSEVGATTNLPWSGYDENSGFTVLGRAESRKNSGGGRYQAATPGYFEATGMRLIEGRLFDWTHEAANQPNTLIVNEALAKLFFPKGDAIGSTLEMGVHRQIVGILADIKDSPADLKAKPAFWYPLTQVGFTNVFFAIRVHPGVDPASLTAAIGQAVHSVDPDLPLADVRTLERRATAALASRLFALWLFQAFAALALVLAAAGIYGLLAYLVEQRAKELSIRLALGAGRGDLVRLVLSDGVKMAASGALVCLLLIPAGGYLLRSFLYNVQAFDLFTLAGAPALLLLIALIASLGPARSAMKSDPAVALRED